MKTFLVLSLTACVAASAIAAEPSAHRASARSNFLVAAAKGSHGTPGDVCARAVPAPFRNQAAKRSLEAAGSLAYVDSPVGRLRVVKDGELATATTSTPETDGTAAIVVIRQASMSDSSVRRVGSVPVSYAQRAKGGVGSALYTAGTPEVSRYVTDVDGGRLTLLAAGGQDPTVLGGILDQNERGTLRSFAFVMKHGTYEQDAKDILALTALEHLYALVLEREPTRTFSFGPVKGTSKAGFRGVGSQWSVLQSLAVARECVAARLGSWAGSKGIKLWHTVTLKSSGASNAHDQDSVAVRAVSERGAVVGATVSFSKAPHMACTALTDRTGTAACTLWDLHGHAEGHEDEDAAIAASFSGVVRLASIDLPTTFVFSKR